MTAHPRQLAGDAARYVQDVRVTPGGAVEARFWCMARQEPVWAPVAVPDWLPLDKARAAAQSGRLIAWVSHRRRLLSLERKEGAGGR